MLPRCQQSPPEVKIVEVVVDFEVPEEEADAEPSEADKIILVKITKISQIKLPETKNLTKKDPGMLMGPQIRPAPGTGPLGGARPTALIPWSVGGPQSSRHALKIEVLACLV